MSTSTAPHWHLLTRARRAKSYDESCTRHLSFPGQHPLRHSHNQTYRPSSSLCIPNSSGWVLKQYLAVVWTPTQRFSLTCRSRIFPENGIVQETCCDFTHIKMRYFFYLAYCGDVNGLYARGIGMRPSYASRASRLLWLRAVQRKMYVTFGSSKLDCTFSLVNRMQRPTL
jgi:hypothetical protein